MHASFKVGLVIGTAVLGSGLSAPPAQAAYIVTLAQEGSNVVATGSGTIDLAGLTLVYPTGVSDRALVFATAAFISTGPASFTPIASYTGFIGPTNFGMGPLTLANSGSGDIVRISGAVNELDVPQSYVSGNSLADTSTYDNQTFSSLGVTPGTYVYTFGSGANADSFTVQIGVPEPASLALLGTGLLGLGLITRRRTGNL